MDELLSKIKNRLGYEDINESIIADVLYDVERAYAKPQDKLSQLVELVEEWSTKRGLDVSDSTKQLVKMQEELGELSQGFLKKKPGQIIDSLGDLEVVIIIFCQQNGLKLEDVLGKAYEVIKNRDGKLIDGSFVKEEDLA